MFKPITTAFLFTALVASAKEPDFNDIHSGATVRVLTRAGECEAHVLRRTTDTISVRLSNNKTCAFSTRDAEILRSEVVAVTDVSNSGRGLGSGAPKACGRVGLWTGIAAAVAIGSPVSLFLLPAGMAGGVAACRDRGPRYAVFTAR